jgi:hypothetical protein
MAGGENFDLPESLRDVAAVIGRQRTMELVGKISKRSKNGPRAILYIPKKASGSRLEELLGLADAEKLAEAFPREILSLGQGWGHYLRFRNNAIRRMRANGATESYTAWAFDMCERQIRNICR